MDGRINSEVFKKLFSKSGDVLIRPIKINQNNIIVHLFCVDGLINQELFDTAVFKSLKFDPYLSQCKTERQMMDYLLEGGAYHVFTKEETDYNLLLKYVLSGMVALIFDKEEKAIVYDIRKFEKRSVSEPTEENVMKGSKDSFIEVMRMNTALISKTDKV